jgi:hypothetical protein
MNEICMYTPTDSSCCTLQRQDIHMKRHYPSRRVHGATTQRNMIWATASDTQSAKMCPNVFCSLCWDACALYCFVLCCRLTSGRCVLQPDEALSDDFLFPMTSRLSYASSPESDLDLSPEPRCAVPPGSTAPPPGPGPGPPRLVKSSSDPSIATQEDGGVPSYSAPPPYSPSNHYRQVSVCCPVNWTAESEAYCCLGCGAV